MTVATPITESGRANTLCRCIIVSARSEKPCPQPQFVMHSMFTLERGGTSISSAANPRLRARLHGDLIRDGPRRR